MSGLAGAGSLSASALAALQVFDPGVLNETNVVVRAITAFLIVVVFGAVLLIRRETYVSQSVDAVVSMPLRAIGYGLVAHFGLALIVAYLASQLSPLRISGVNVGNVSLLLGIVALLAVAAAGFTVVGSTVFTLWGQPNAWAGLILGGMVAGGVVLGQPTVAAVLWLGLVSLGIGGSIRNWMHASALDDIQTDG